MMSDHSYSGGSSGGGSTAVMTASADTYVPSREPGWFRTRLSLRLAVPIDPAARLAAWRLTVSAALLAPPIVVLLIAPAAHLSSRTLIALCCVGLPGAAALVWSGARLRETRRHITRGLRQAGAEHRTAWLIAAGRPALFAAAGAICGAACVALLHAPLGALLPKHAPLHGLFGAGARRWLAAVLQTTVIAVAAVLVVSEPTQQRRERGRRGVRVRRRARAPAERR